MNKDNDRLEELEQDLLKDQGISEALAEHCELDDGCPACATREAIDSLAPLVFSGADPEDVALSMCEGLASSLNVIAGATKAAAWLNLVALEATRIISFFELEDHDDCDHDHEEEDNG